MTKIIQISDTHIVPRGQLAYETVDTAEALAETVATINRMLLRIGPVDMVFVTGDLTEHGTEAEYERFKNILSDLKVPYLAVPGNHDRREPMREAFQDTGWMTEEGPVNWCHDLEDFTVVGLDCLVDGRAHGEFSSKTISFLKAELARLTAKPVLIGFHHPPFRVGITPMDIQNLIDAGPFAEAFAGYQGEIRLVCGHLHRSIAGLFEGHLCQVCPGTSHAVTLDQRSDAGNSLTIEPGGFMLHEWRDNRFLSHLIPVGTFSGPHPFLGV
jgi:3',5'-cyclic AMP phosphodiesterase CpdA